MLGLDCVLFFSLGKRLKSEREEEPRKCELKGSDSEKRLVRNYEGYRGFSEKMSKGVTRREFEFDFVRLRMLKNYVMSIKRLITDN